MRMNKDDEDDDEDMAKRLNKSQPRVSNVVMFVHHFKHKYNVVSLYLIKSYLVLLSYMNGMPS